MSLFRMELYKILHKKSVLITGLLMILWMTFYLFMQVSDEHTMVDGVDYYGRQAIQKDRESTAEYEGVFTDETASSIIARYGFRASIRVYRGLDEASGLPSDRRPVTGCMVYHYVLHPVQ